jgi:hypothetical protein
MTEIEHEGAEVALALQNMGTAEAMAAALPGCSFYLDDPDETFEIITVDRAGGRIELQRGARGKRLTIAALARGYVIESRDPSVISALTTQAKPPHIIAAEEARLRLQRAGIRAAAVSNEDAPEIDQAVADYQAGKLPSWSERRRITELLFRYELHDPFIQLAEAWLGMAHDAGEKVLGDVLIQVVDAYRKKGDGEAVLYWTSSVDLPRNLAPLPPTQMSILNVQRGATLLDLYDRDGDPAKLKAARLCANRSWAIGPSEHCSALFARIKRLEDALTDEKAAANRQLVQQRLQELGSTRRPCS